jgi:hypothetical protein
MKSSTPQLKKITFYIFLLFMLKNVDAQQWIPVGETENSVTYIDAGSIKKIGNYRRAWLLQDRNTQKEGTLSFRALSEYDCQNERLRDISVTSHSKNMAAGDASSVRSEPGPWKYPAPGTVLESIFTYVCKK